MSEDFNAEEELISEFVRYASHVQESFGNLDTYEKSVEYSNNTRESVEIMLALMPDVKDEELTKILENFENKILGFEFRDSPEISQEHQDLIDKAGERYELLRAGIEKKMNNFFGKSIYPLISSLLYFLNHNIT